MQSNNTNNTSSHYREHTRQQDGWTVLSDPAPAPAAQPEPELPPPYTADPPPPPPPTINLRSRANNHNTTLACLVPTNSNVVGAPRVTRTLRYVRNADFAQAWNEICHHMGLDPYTACLGYKWDNDKANATIHALANAKDWQDCLENGIGQTERARTRNVTCNIQNLKSPEETASLPPAPTGKKRKADAPAYDNGKRTFEFTHEYRQLKAALSKCEDHRGQSCWVNNGGHHHIIEPEHITLWAKEISMGHVSAKKPPENIVFQKYFLSPRKRRRTRAPTPPSPTAKQSPCNPMAINVTVNTGGGSGSAAVSSPRTPLATITQSSSLTHSQIV
ncbi:hypothetical protein R3P38DRAFT_3204594 [Favolaschia claudopus]|uniref:Uncharacterized protein n=1 Tax=Favolaschia claudopus TaxID=2862362 RepID=A0AAW0AQR6_9AGAR